LSLKEIKCSHKALSALDGNGFSNVNISAPLSSVEDVGVGGRTLKAPTTPDTNQISPNAQEYDSIVKGFEIFKTKKLKRSKKDQVFKNLKINKTI